MQRICGACLDEPSRFAGLYAAAVAALDAAEEEKTVMEAVMAEVDREEAAVRRRADSLKAVGSLIRAVGKPVEPVIAPIDEVTASPPVTPRPGSAVTPRQDWQQQQEILAEMLIPQREPATQKATTTIEKALHKRRRLSAVAHGHEAVTELAAPSIAAAFNPERELALQAWAGSVDIVDSGTDVGEGCIFGASPEALKAQLNGSAHNLIAAINDIQSQFEASADTMSAGLGTAWMQTLEEDLMQMDTQLIDVMVAKLPASFEILLTSGVAVNAGIDCSSEEVGTLPLNCTFSPCEFGLSADGTRRVRLEEPFAGWVCWTIDTLKPVAIHAIKITMYG